MLLLGTLRQPGHRGSKHELSVDLHVRGDRGLREAWVIEVKLWLSQLPEIVSEHVSCAVTDEKHLEHISVPSAFLRRKLHRKR